MPPKQKGTKMDLGAFLQDSDVAGGAWSDAIDLPTAPIAAFSAAPANSSSEYNAGSGYSSRRDDNYAPVDLNAIPSDPPFTAFIGNLSFDVTEHELETFFGSDIKIKHVRFIVDMATNKPKGYGYVEFIDRDSLIGAIKMNGESLQKRNIRINVAEQKARPGRPGQVDESKFQGNWRNRTAVEPAFKSTNTFGGREDRPAVSSWASGFQRNNERNDRDRPAPFQRRPQEPAVAREPVAPREPAKPKPNPFGNATPRDELAIQKELEERRLAREKENAEREAKEIESKKVQEAEKAMEKTKISTAASGKHRRDHDRPAPPPENVPSGAGSWRRAAGAKPAGVAARPAFRKGSGDKGSLNSISTETSSGGFHKSHNQKREFEKGTRFQKKPVTSPSVEPQPSSAVSPKNPYEMLNEDAE